MKTLPVGTTDVVICSRSGELKADETFAGTDAVQVPCSECRASCWLAPHTEYVGPHRVWLCIACARDYGFDIRRRVGRG